jgi:hypothetical protein
LPLSIYVRALRENRSLGVAETSSYGALQALLNAVGAGLSPTVRCILHPQSQGAGLPDGGLFTREQLQPLGQDFAAQTALQMTPARGVLEVKGTSANLQTLIDSQQVKKYLTQYRKVICTNYREFAVVEQQNGSLHVLETLSLAASESAFWAATVDADRFEKEQGERFTAFLERALLYGAPLASPEAVAAFMASCAREAKIRVARADVPELDRVRVSLEAALNVSFNNERADVFFRSSLVQTLFYGVFSAWVLWCRENPISGNAQFDWRTSVYYLRVPVIEALFHEIAKPQTLQSLNVMEPLNWVTDALNRVDRPAFEERFEDGSAVQYFYEPFLEAFDPELRRQLGVWYTPISVVRYMVSRVDDVLKSELGIADGLADERVVVLDPCCGTGAFLVEVIHHIARTLAARGEDALGASDLKNAVLNRLYGFELLTAPFVVAHLQIGLLLQTLGVPLAARERSQIFLTNALTGWQQPNGEQLKIDLPGLQQEREAAEVVKRQEKILVILGNPPYDGFSGVAIGEERDLSEAYRQTINPALPRPEGQGLNELYVRFFRMAERKITEGTGEGVVCFISNYSWLDGKSHPGMREAYLNRFSKVWIDNLNGDRFRTGKMTPDNLPDPSIFSTLSNSEGIQVGTAIALLVKKPETNSVAQLRYRDLWGTGKHIQLEAETQRTINSEYGNLQPPVALGLPFMRTHTNAEYTSWPLLPELFPVSFPGVQTKRDDLVIDIDRQRLIDRMVQYFDVSVSHQQMGQICQRAMETNNQFDAIQTRETLQKRGYISQNLVRYIMRPFDARWLYWEDEAGLLGRRSPEYKPQVFEGNMFIEARPRLPQLTFDRGLFTTVTADNLGNGFSNYYPLYIRELNAVNLFAEDSEPRFKPNLSTDAIAYLDSFLDIKETSSSDVADSEDVDHVVKQDNVQPSTLFFHTLAIQHAPKYRRENADALRLSWPRIPLPNASELLKASDKLGETVAALIDVLQPVETVTTGSIRSELRIFGNITRLEGGALNPEAGELGIRVNWGYKANGAVMPGSGRAIERPWTQQERDAIEAGAALLGLDLATALVHLGETAYDVYLNDVAYWKGVPARVWSYTMGGYRVFKKWLSYREADVLGRDLLPAEAREARDIVRRIAALLLIESLLDANYNACIASTVSLAGKMQT